MWNLLVTMAEEQSHIWFWNLLPESDISHLLTFYWPRQVSWLYLSRRYRVQLYCKQNTDEIHCMLRLASQNLNESLPEADTHTLRKYQNSSNISKMSKNVSSNLTELQSCIVHLRICWGRGWQRMRCLDGITNLMDMSLRKLWSWWWTGKPGVLQSMGSQRVGHDWVAELNWTEEFPS